MRSEERRVFTTQAKALADEQKRLNPDCWKRKRTNSVRRRTQNQSTSEPRHPPHLWCLALWSSAFSFRHLQSEWWCWVPTYVKKPGHTHAHTHFLILPYFFMLSIFFFPYPPGLSGKLGMQTRRKKQPVRPADILVQHIQTWQGALHIFKLLGDILYRQTHLHLPQQGPDSFSKIWKPHQSKLQQSQFFAQAWQKGRACSICFRHVKWDNSNMLRLGS